MAVSTEHDFIRSFLDSLVRTIKEHPTLLIAAAVPLIAAATLPAALAMLGFTAAGPVLGSLAAIWQSSIGSVPKGHLFSLIQSISMTTNAIYIGAGVGLVAAVIIVVDYATKSSIWKDTKTWTAIQDEVAKFRQFAGSVVGTISSEANKLINSPEVKAGLEGVKHAGTEALKGADGFFEGLGHKMGWWRRSRNL